MINIDKLPVRGAKVPMPGSVPVYSYRDLYRNGGVKSRPEIIKFTVYLNKLILQI